MHLYVYCLIHKTARHCLAARLVLFIEWFSLICLFIPCWSALNYIFFSRVYWISCLISFLLFSFRESHIERRWYFTLAHHFYLFFLHHLFNCFIDLCSIYLVIQSIPVEIYFLFIYLFIHLLISIFAMWLSRSLMHTFRTNSQ